MFGVHLWLAPAQERNPRVPFRRRTKTFATILREPIVSGSHRVADERRRVQKPSAVVTISIFARNNQETNRFSSTLLSVSVPCVRSIVCDRRSASEVKAGGHHVIL